MKYTNSFKTVLLLKASYEFKAFIEQSSKDQFGLKIKLLNGIVASRVLPIQIHDLKSEDKMLIEKELGGFIRAVEFIYKETGVNRPLTPRDSGDRNINKTNYRNPINKVANAIDEIISALEAEPVPVVKEKDQSKESFREIMEVKQRINLQEHAKNTKRKLLSILAIVSILIVAAILAYPKFFKRNTLEKLRSSGDRISIAVMPFLNITSDPVWNIWQDGIKDELINYLTNFEELKIIQAESIDYLIQSKGLTDFSYTSITLSMASTFSRKLDAKVFINGSIKQSVDPVKKLKDIEGKLIIPI